MEELFSVCSDNDNVQMSKLLITPFNQSFDPVKTSYCSIDPSIAIKPMENGTCPNGYNASGENTCLLSCAKKKSVPGGMVTFKQCETDTEAKDEVIRTDFLKSLFHLQNCQTSGGDQSKCSSFAEEVKKTHEPYLNTCTSPCQPLPGQEGLWCPIVAQPNTVSTTEEESAEACSSRTKLMEELMGFSNLSHFSGQQCVTYQKSSHVFPNTIDIFVPGTDVFYLGKDSALQVAGAMCPTKDPTQLWWPPPICWSCIRRAAAAAAARARRIAAAAAARARRIAAAAAARARRIAAAAAARARRIAADIKRKAEAAAREARRIAAEVKRKAEAAARAAAARLAAIAAEIKRKAEAAAREVARLAAIAAEKLRLKEIANAIAKKAQEATTAMVAVGNDIGNAAKAVVDKAKEIGEAAVAAIAAEALALWEDIQGMFGGHKDRLYNLWRQNMLTGKWSFTMDGKTSYRLMLGEHHIKTPTKTSKSTQNDMILTRIPDLLNIPLEGIKTIIRLKKQADRTLVDNGLLGFTLKNEWFNLGKKTFNTWQLECPDNHIIVPKIRASWAKDKKAWYGETFQEKEAFLHMNNHCGTIFKTPADPPKSLLAKAADGVKKGIEFAADVVGVTTMVFSNGTKQCCRQHRLCLLGYTDAMETQWAAGVQRIDGTACEQQYFECLGSCAFMGDVQKTIADIFGLTSLKGGCPTSKDVSDEVGKGSGSLLETGTKVASFIAAQGTKHVVKKAAQKKILKKIGAKPHLDYLKEYKNAKNKKLDLSKFKGKGLKKLKTAKLVKFGVKMAKTIPKLIKEVAVFPALAFSSQADTVNLPIEEHWMCVPRDPCEIEGMGGFPTRAIDASCGGN
jgi:hypothetical protein